MFGLSCWNLYSGTLFLSFFISYYLSVCFSHPHLQGRVFCIVSEDQSDLVILALHLGLLGLTIIKSFLFLYFAFSKLAYNYTSCTLAYKTIKCSENISYYFANIYTIKEQSKKQPAWHNVPQSLRRLLPRLIILQGSS